jgi:hypothetical protein
MAPCSRVITHCVQAPYEISLLHHGRQAHSAYTTGTAPAAVGVPRG